MVYYFSVPSLDQQLELLEEVYVSDRLWYAGGDEYATKRTIQGQIEWGDDVRLQLIASLSVQGSNYSGRKGLN